MSVIAVDFDGTIVTHEYPLIGMPVPYAVVTLKKLQEKGHKLILLTMRSGKELKDAVEYCADMGIHFWGVNDNPEQHRWTDSRKVYANVYIDDANCCQPLLPTTTKRQMVDWKAVHTALFGIGLRIDEL